MYVFSDLPQPLRKLIRERIRDKSLKTPVILISESAVRSAFASFLEYIPTGPSHLHFPVKVNNQQGVLGVLDSLGSGFEIASAGELELLKQLKVQPRRIIFSNPVKMPAHIALAHQYGIREFAFDTVQELKKLKKYAPRCRVHLRLAVSNSGAAWKLDSKFGADAQDAVSLMQQALRAGLIPYGLCFHVGWNNHRLSTWEQALRTVAGIVAACFNNGIEIRSVNIGGGFPAHLNDQMLHLKRITERIKSPLEQLKSRYGIIIKAEPGSFVCANAAALLTRVTEVIHRHNKNWAFVDTGIGQGFYWILSHIRYPVIFPSDQQKKRIKYSVTGPTCDSQDVFEHDAQLPSDLKSGDVLLVWPAGAYISSAKDYNGYAWPESITG